MTADMPKHTDDILKTPEVTEGVDIENASCKAISESALSPDESRRLLRLIDLW
jgi:hypothetical protein